MVHKHTKSSFNRIVLLIALISLILFCSRVSSIQQNTAVSIYGVDLIAFHTAAKLASQGNLDEIYVVSGKDFSGVDSGKFSQTARSSGFEFQPTRYVYLPVFLIPFQVLSYFNFSDAAFLLLSINILILLVIILLQWKLTRDVFSPAVGFAFVVAINMMSYPVFYGLKLGQTTLAVYLCVCLIYYFTLKKQDARAGIVLGFIIILKYTPLIFALYFLYKKKYKLLIFCFGTVAGLVLLSISRFGLPLHKSYWLLIKGVSAGGIAGWSNQSLLAFFLRQLGGNSALSYDLLTVSTGLFVLNCFGVGLILLGTCYYIWQNKEPDTERNFPLEFSAITLCFLIVPSVSWLHYFCIASLPVIIIIISCLKAGRAPKKNSIIMLSILSCCIIFLYPNVYKLIFIFDKTFVTRIIISFPLIGACVLLAVNCFMLSSGRFVKGDGDLQESKAEKSGRP